MRKKNQKTEKMENEEKKSNKIETSRKKFEKNERESKKHRKKLGKKWKKNNIFFNREKIKETNRKNHEYR